MTVINTPVAKMFCIDHAPFWTKCWVWIKKLGVKRQTHPSTLAFYYEKFQTYGKIIHIHQVCSVIGHILLHLPLLSRGERRWNCVCRVCRKGSARRPIPKCLSPPKHQINFYETHNVLVTSKGRVMIDDFVSPELQCLPRLSYTVHSLFSKCSGGGERD